MALSQRQEPIAIVGVGLRVPGAETPEEFLRLLRERVCRIGPVPDGRGVAGPGGYLDRVDWADWRALGIPPREMRQVDPQHRLLLEVAREALEDAGLTRKRLAGHRVGVAVGLIWDDYLRELERNGGTDGYTVLGNVASFAANRISFHFDFKGPSVALNAACASGLVAVHEACRMLRLGEADVALAGSCELMLSAESDRMMQGLGVLSPTGRCLPLDARADGFVRGEGAGMVVLKRLADVEPWERVYAVIAGSAVNHNGRNEWLMASSEAALAEVVREACRAAGISADELAYVELHGSGGPKGDAAEIGSLVQAGANCRVGSVKGNLGHLGAASGIVSLIKVALGLREREWLPMVLEEPRTDLDWRRLEAVRSVEKWEGEALAGVTATSLSGTNAHVILRAVENPAMEKKDGAGKYRVPVWGHTSAALENRSQKLKEWVKEHPEVAVEDVAFTCAHGREELAFAGEVEIGEGAFAAIPEFGRIVSLPLFPWQRERFSTGTAVRREVVGKSAVAEEAVARPSFTALELQKILQELLELPELPPTRATFFDLGLNSMMLAELSTKLGIPATAFFEFPTIAKLAAGTKVSSAISTGGVKIPGTAVAVVGMACRFPGGAETPERFWNLLREGRDAFGPVPAGRNLPLERGAFLDEVDGFDAGFWRVSPKEAAQMDPQQRLFLEVAWEALENAGVDAARLEGSRTGVYAGAFAHDYGNLRGPVDAYHFSGVDIGFNANRVSFALGLRGPSLTVDTACSSSLVALHLAVRALRAGECGMALAGGVSLMLASEIHEFLAAAGTLSPGGVCRAFDRNADGMARGEGCGVVVLKRLEDAIAAGDNVLAVIRGTAVNHGGASGGLTVPNPVAQAELYRAALEDAGAKADEVVYLEAHGTGTKLGDPVELRGIADVYGGPLRIGTVKANIGHADAAAGIAGFIKTVLMLRAGEAPPQRNFAAPTAEFDWARHGIAVPTQVERLPEGLVAVSSFGLGGTNAHVVLEGQGTRDKGQGDGTGAVVLPLSARSSEALAELAAAWARELESGTVAVVDAAWTAGRSRAGLPVRAAVAGRSARELAEKLRGELVGAREALERTEWRTAFVFPGQGGQWVGMESGLMAANPVFRDAIAEIDATFRPLAGRGILEFAPDEVHETRVAQPAIFAMQVGLAAAWRAMGVQPDVVVGHSMGEIAAACVAGCLSLPDAVRVIYERSRVLEEASGGRMLVAALSADEAAELVEPFADSVAVGVVNGPRSVVLSGAAAAIRVLAEELRERDVFCREVQVKYASHCPQVERFREPVRQVLAGIRPRAGEIPFRSTMLGRVVSGTELGAEYWAANFCEPVRFSDAVEELAREGVAAFVEMSPHPTLETAVSSCLEAVGSDAAVVTSLKRDAAEEVALLESVGRLYCAGYPVDFARVNPAGRVAALPNYPWQRKRYWIAASAVERTGKAVHPLLGERVKSPLPQEQYQAVVSKNSPEWLAGHGLRGEVYFPAAGFAEIALAARSGAALRDVKFEAPLLLGDEAVRLQLTVDGDRFTVHSSRDGAEWERHVSGVYGAVVVAGELDAPGGLRIVEDFYEGLERRGYQYDGAFRSVRRVEVGAGVAVAEVAGLEGEFRLHPAVLDGCLQAALVLTKGGLLVPVGMEGVEVQRVAVSDLRAAVRRNGEKFDIEIFDNEGICARVTGLELKAIGGERAAWESWCFQTAWIAALPPVATARARQRFRIVGVDEGLQKFLEGRGHEYVASGAAEHVIYLAGGGDLERMYADVLSLAQELETAKPAPRLWIVTRGAQALAGEPVDAEQAGLWGLARVVARELPGHGCTCVDMDPQCELDWREFLREMMAEPGEQQVMLRRGKRYVARVEPVRFAEREKAFRIGVEAYGQLDGLKAMPLKAREPGAGQVRIRTEVVPLNFRDVLNALGMLPEYAAELGIGAAAEMPFGFECAGVVDAVGAGVTKVAVGDRVVAGPVTGALASHVEVDARRVLRVPEGVDAGELACMSVAWMTAFYGLESLAKLKAGERVLIHAAAGGVGMAAIGIARRIGAQVIATASPEKWDVLRAMGVKEIYNSRDAGVAEKEIRADVVLNSLTGAMVAASLRVCAPGARFIEIGKKDIWTAEQVAAVRPDVEYHAFTFSEVADERPELVEEMLGRMAEAPRLPVTRFGVGEVAAAFRYMAQARHVGKVAIVMGRRGGLSVHSDGVYWVTGGGGALGRLVAEWLVGRGAERVIVSGRRASADFELGERMEYRQGDVSSAESVEALVAEIGAELRGVVHAAGVIEDATIAAQTVEKFHRVNAAKAVAARNLGVATKGLKLDFLVLFSSTAAVLGPGGQANYAAANAAMDAAAHNLRAAGRPALSIEWGPWGEVGLAAELSEGNRRRLAGRGMDFMEPWLCLEVMDALAGTGLAVAAVAPVNWEQFVADLPAGASAAMFERVTKAKNAAKRNLLAELDAATEDERRAVLEGFVREQIARSLGLADGGAIGERQRLFDLGFDSLMAVELRNRLEVALKRPLRRTLVFDFPRVGALVEHLADVLGLKAAAVVEVEEEKAFVEGNEEIEERLAAASQLLGEEL